MGSQPGRIFLHISLLLLVLHFFYGCSDDAFFMGLRTAQEPAVFRSSVAVGESLSPGEKINLSFEYDSSRLDPEALLITLFGPEGETLSSTVIPGDKLLSPIPPFSLDSAGPGLHTLEMNLLNKRNETISEARYVFFITPNAYRVRSVESFPPSPFPGGNLLLIPRISGTGDPWIRWSMNRNTIGEGFLSRYGEGFVWRIPQEIAGVLTIRMEVFPFSPPESPAGGFAFSSPVFFDMEIFVDPEEKGKTWFQNSENYLYLAYFHASRENAGVSDVAMERAGTPELAVRKKLFGYLLGPGNGFSADEILLPVGPERSLSPFSLSFLLSIVELEESRNLFAVDGGSDFSFRLGTDDTGDIRAEINFTDLRISDYPSISAGELKKIKELIVSVIPESGVLVFNWYGDGKLLSAAEYPYPAGERVPLSGKTVLGGVDSLDLLISEFGIYYRDNHSRPSSDPDIFSRNIRQGAASKDILYAQGFSGLYTDDLTVTAGNVSVHGGALRILPGTEIEIFDIPENVEHSAVLLSFLRETAGAAGYLKITEKMENRQELGTVDFIPSGFASTGSGGRAVTIHIQKSGESGPAVIVVGNDGELPFGLEFILIRRVQPKDRQEAAYGALVVIY